MTKVYKILSQIIFFVVASIIYYFVKESITTLDIVSYVFILLAYSIVVLTPILTENQLNKTIQDLPVYLFSYIYLGIEIIMAVVIAYKNNIETSQYILIQSIITGIYLTIFFAILYVNGLTNNSLKKQKFNKDFIKELRCKLNTIIIKCANEEIKNEISELEEILKFSPISSHEKVYDIENNILTEIENLKTLVNEETNINQIKEYCLNLKKLILERNTKLK